MFLKPWFKKKQTSNLVSCPHHCRVWRQGCTIWGRNLPQTPSSSPSTRRSWRRPSRPKAQSRRWRRGTPQPWCVLWRTEKTASCVDPRMVRAFDRHTAAAPTSFVWMGEMYRIINMTLSVFNVWSTCYDKHLLGINYFDKYSLCLCVQKMRLESLYIYFGHEDIAVWSIYQSGQFFYVS